MTTFFDGYAGGGGTSTGLHMLSDVEVKYAVDFWDKAVETHAANHPNTEHDCVDMSQVDPKRYARTDFGWFSPACTHHSKAQGKKRDTSPVGEIDGWDSLVGEENDITRATMFEVIRFSEAHKYDGVIVENVPDILDWRLYPYWLKMMKGLGYNHKHMLVNSMNCVHNGPSVAQSRLRYYGLFWQGDIEPEYPEFTEQKIASELYLDKDPGILLSKRSRPLATSTQVKVDATMERYPDEDRLLVIYYGATKWGKPTSEPVGTLTVKDRHGLLTKTSEGWAYRMLNLAELTRLGGFPETYQWAGNQADAKKMIGNAVSPCAARDIARPMIEACGRI